PPDRILLERREQIAAVLTVEPQQQRMMLAETLQPLIAECKLVERAGRRAARAADSGRIPRVVVADRHSEPTHVDAEPARPDRVVVVPVADTRELVPLVAAGQLADGLL